MGDRLRRNSEYASGSNSRSGVLGDSSDHALARRSSHAVQTGKMDSRCSGDRTEPIGRRAVTVVPERRRHERRRQSVSRAATTTTAGMVEVRRRRSSTTGVGADASRRRGSERPGRAGKAVDGSQVVGRRLVVSRRQIEGRLTGDGRVMMLVMVVDGGRRQRVVLLVTFALHRRLAVSSLNSVLLHRQRSIHLHDKHETIDFMRYTGPGKTREVR